MDQYRDKFAERIERRLVILDGSFAPNSTYDSSSEKGQGFSIAYNGIGDYTLTFNEVYLSLVSANINLQLHAAADAMAEFGDIDLAAKTVAIRIVKKSDGTTAVDPAPNANTRIAFSFKLKQTSAN